MGSVRFPPRRRDGEISVLVTGFGPFRQYGENPSWLIAQSLPQRITASKVGKPISIYMRPEPVKVAYREVRDQIPPLLFTAGEDDKLGAQPIFDIVLHIGVSSARGFYEMETRAFRDDYITPDVDGSTSIGDHKLWKDEGAPEIVHTGFDSHAVLAEWKKNLKPQKVDLRRSIDAGRYLCEYILFTSLFEYKRKQPGRPAPVTFLHVPSEAGAADLERGRDVAVGLIKALADHLPHTA